MSFYGSVFYEFERLFFKFKFKNVADDVDTVDLRDIDSTDGITATERWDTFHIDSGNRWIKLATMPEGGERKGVTLFHAEAGPSKHEQSTMEVCELEEGQTPDVNLGAHQVFKVPTIAYDNAGHIVSADTTIYQLPDPNEVVSDGMEKHFDEDVSPQGFEHEYEKFPDDDESYVVLEPGQPVVVNKFLISDKGIVTGVEPVFYKMPASDAEQDFAELSERMDAAEETLEAIPETYATIESTGTIADLYYGGMDTAINPSERFASLALAIGNIEESGREITGNIRDIPSVASQLKTTHELTTALSLTTSTAIGELTKKVEDLVRRVEALEQS